RSGTRCRARRRWGCAWWWVLFSRARAGWSFGFVRARAGRPLPGDRHPLDAVDEVAAEAVGWRGEVDVGEAVDDLAHGGLDLGPGEARAEAVVDAATAEGHVVVRRAAHVEAVRVVEDLLVAVRRRVVHDDLLAGLDRHPPALAVVAG